MGGGGFLSHRNFFSLSNSLSENVLGTWHEYLLGLIFVHEFFFPLILPCANIFFCTSPAPTPVISFLMVRPLIYHYPSDLGSLILFRIIPLGSSQRNAPQVSLINYYLPSSCLPFSIFLHNNVIAIRCKSWCSFFHLKIRIHSHEYELVFIC